MKRILFVDDEIPVLEGLRLRLHRRGPKWDMVFVDSGERALAELERTPCDVIVADMRMPGMDGAEVLKIVSERWPQTVRIVLSGYAELQQTIRLVPIAHQYLCKPCDPALLENSIDRCLVLQELLGQPRLRAVVGRIRTLPAIPRTYAKLQSLMTRENVSAQDVAQIVAADAVIAAKVLQLVNSAFFRLARRTTNIDQAVTYLGFSAVRNLVLSAEVFSNWPGKTTAVLDVERLQAHVQSVAAVTHALTAKTALADDALLAALLHDIGYWVLLQECPQELERAIELSRSEQIPIHAAETHLIGASHAEIGAYLLGIWGLPYTIIEAVAHHHEPRRVSQTGFDVLGALVVAHSLVQPDDTGAMAEGTVPDAGVDAHYLDALKAPFNWNEAAHIANETLAEQGSPE